MQPAIKEYKDIMESDLRSRSFVNIYLGVVNKKAQECAFTNSEYTDYSEPTKIFDNYKFEAYYITAEENFAKVNGAQYFKPEDTNNYALYQGAVTKDILGTVVIDFGTEILDIKGLTIDFGEFYPTHFYIVTENKTIEVTENNSGNFVTEEIFENSSSIEIVPVAMVGGQQRLRILSVLFGVGIMFSNSNIKSTSRIDKKSPINEELPYIEFSFTVGNTDSKFNKDNPTSYSNFLEEKQECEFSYGREMSDGSIYQIKGGKTLLKSWSSDDSVAKFVSVCRMSYMDSFYYKGKYYSSGISLFDLSELVLIDGGIENYYIDPYLKTIIVYNPLPEAMHKECLQIIANAGRCVLGEDRDGRITLISSFFPDILSISGTVMEEYSDLNNLFNDTAVINYADATQDYSTVDGNRYFITSGTNYLECGFVSSISDSTGLFAVSPKITVEFESQLKIFGLSILFGGCVPEELTIHQYNNGILVASNAIDSLNDVTFVNQETEYFDKLVFEFTKAKPNNKIRVNKIILGDNTDYTITYNSLTSIPDVSDIEKVSSVKISMYKYKPGTALKELSVFVGVLGSNIIKFSNASHGYSIASASGTAIISNFGAYYVEIICSVSEEITISGYEYSISEGIFSKQVQDSGKIQYWKNPLVSESVLASNVADWLSEYFINDVEYDLLYRGDPRIDSNDLCYLENKFVENNKIRILSSQIDTAGGMSQNCKLNGRRVSYGVDNT